MDVTYEQLVAFVKAFKPKNKFVAIGIDDPALFADPAIPGPLGSRWFDWPHFRDDGLGRLHVLPVAIRDALGVAG